MKYGLLLKQHQGAFNSMNLELPAAAAITPSQSRGFSKHSSPRGKGQGAGAQAVRSASPRRPSPLRAAGARQPGSNGSPPRHPWAAAPPAEGPQSPPRAVPNAGNMKGGGSPRRTRESGAAKVLVECESPTMAALADGGDGHVLLQSAIPLKTLVFSELGPIGKPFSGQSAGRSGQIPLHIPIEQYLVRKASSMTPDSKVLPLFVDLK